MRKKGQIWISAVLYIALGVIAITIVLSAGIPIINKIKDKNTIIQTKDILLSLDNVIREVRDDGPGSKRVIQPFIIKEGDLLIAPLVSNSNENKIKWSLKTNTIYAEPCGKTKDDCMTNNPEFIIKEGSLEIYQTNTLVEDEYFINLELGFEKIGFLNVISDIGKNSPLLGRYSLIIKNAGLSSGKQLPDIEIEVN